MVRTVKVIALGLIVTGVAGLSCGTASASGVLPARAVSWHYAWSDRHTPTKSWSTKNVYLPNKAVAVGVRFRCWAPGTIRVQIRNKDHVNVRTSGVHGCNGNWQWFSSGVSGHTYYFHFKLTKKHTVEAKAYYGT